MAAAVDDEVFTTYLEDGQWWCYYRGLATTGATREDAEYEMRAWIVERNSDEPDA